MSENPQDWRDDGPEANLMRQILGASADLHALFPDNGPGPERVKFACGVSPETEPKALRATFVMDDVTCPGCWDAIRVRAKGPDHV